AFFERLRNGIMQAGTKGIYVEQQLFQGWSVYSYGGATAWFGHPFNGANNINGINADLNGDNDGSEYLTLSDPAVTALQDAYVRQMIDRLGDLDNVLWEVCNECN